MRGHEILLQDELQAVGRCLREAADAEGLPVLLETEQRERQADAVWTHAVLDHGGDAALKVNGDRDQRQDDQKAEKDDLSHRDGEEGEIEGGKRERGGHRRGDYPGARGRGNPIL